MESQSQTERPQDPQDEVQQEPKKPDNTTLTFRIWPPSQRTRDAVISRLIETLTTTSVLSKRYGALPADEASSAARTIEEEAFSVADAASSAEDDGIEILQVYSKDISKRMLDAVKSRANSAGVDGNDNGVVVAGGATENAVSTAEAEAEA
ncbi:hypothetical protein JRO89_XS07G0079600 [Xanthoceras sorbifolium]|uniref:WPP domain-containing protein n=1 Tax=Xanthoceras sorbifolium TaxID=99658 RepID=A0ABQ8HT99_9ROSI|nr:hypothetical protein JRO89_XS07G0079600 [Xanthoceras sorbifolium]